MTDTHNLHAAPSGTVRATNAMVDSQSGNAANDGLGAFHRNPQDMEIGNRRSRIIGALVIVLMLGAAGAYVYTMIPAQEESVVSDTDLPRPGSLSEMMPQSTSPAAPDANMPATDPLGAPVTAPPPEGASAVSAAPAASDPVQPAP